MNGYVLGTEIDNRIYELTSVLHDDGATMLVEVSAIGSISPSGIGPTLPDTKTLWVVDAASRTLVRSRSARLFLVPFLSNEVSERIGRRIQAEVLFASSMEELPAQYSLIQNRIIFRSSMTLQLVTYERSKFGLVESDVPYFDEPKPEDEIPSFEVTIPEVDHELIKKQYYRYAYPYVLPNNEVNIERVMRHVSKSPMNLFLASNYPVRLPYFADSDTTLRIGYTVLDLPPNAIQVSYRSGLTRMPLIRGTGTIKKATSLVLPFVSIQFTIDRDGVSNILVPLMRQIDRMPFLPVENKLLNEVHHAYGIAVQEVEVSTIEGQPGALQVSIGGSIFHDHPLHITKYGFGENWNWALFKLYTDYRPIYHDLFSDSMHGSVTFMTPSPEWLNTLDFMQQPVENYKEPVTGLVSALQSRSAVESGVKPLPTIDETALLYDTGWTRGEQVMYRLDNATTPGIIIHPTSLEQLEVLLSSFLSNYDIEAQDVSAMAVLGEKPAILSHIDAKSKTKTRSLGVQEASALLDRLSRFLDSKNQTDGAELKDLKAKLERTFFYVPDERFLFQPTFASTLSVQLSRYSKASPTEVAGRNKPSQYDVVPTRVTWTGVSVQKSNMISELDNVGTSPILQYIGKGDTIIKLVGICESEEAAREIRALYDYFRILAFTYRGIAMNQQYGGYLKIVNDLVNTMGVEFVVPLDLTFASIPGYPEAQQVEMTLISFQPLQDGMEGARRIGVADPSRRVTVRGREALPSVWSEYTNWIRANLDVELYPDLRLPLATDVIAWLDAIRAIGSGARRSDLGDYDRLIYDSLYAIWGDATVEMCREYAAKKPTLQLLRVGDETFDYYVDPDFFVSYKDLLFAELLAKMVVEGSDSSDRTGVEYQMIDQYDVSGKVETTSDIPSFNRGYGPVNHSSSAVLSGGGVASSGSGSGQRSPSSTEAALTGITPTVPGTAPSASTYRNTFDVKVALHSESITDTDRHHFAEISNMMESVSSDRITSTNRTGDAIPTTLHVFSEHHDQTQIVASTQGFLPPLLQQEREKWGRLQMPAASRPTAAQRESNDPIMSTFRYRFQQLKLPRAVVDWENLNPRARIVATQWVDGPWMNEFLMHANFVLWKALGESYRPLAVDSRLVHALVYTESAYDPYAVSPAGARGLMQLRPSTFSRYYARPVEVPDSGRIDDGLSNGIAGMRYLASAMVEVHQKYYPRLTERAVAWLDTNVIVPATRHGVPSDVTAQQFRIYAMALMWYNGGPGGFTEAFEAMQKGVPLSQASPVVRAVTAYARKVLERFVQFDPKVAEMRTNPSSRVWRPSGPPIPTPDIQRLPEAPLESLPSFQKARTGENDAAGKNWLLTGWLDELRHYPSNRLLICFPTVSVTIVLGYRWIRYHRFWNQFYGMYGLMSVDVWKSRRHPSDTAELVFSNTYNKLSNYVWDMAYTTEMMKYFSIVDREKVTSLPDTIMELWYRFTRQVGYIFFDATRDPKLQDLWMRELRSFMLKPGTKLHIRMGYGANLYDLAPVFSGKIVEVSTEEGALQVVAQGHGAELENPLGVKVYKRHGILGAGDEPRNIVSNLFTATPTGPLNIGVAINVLSAGRFLHRNTYGIENFGLVAYTSPVQWDDAETGVNLYSSQPIGENQSGWAFGYYNILGIGDIIHGTQSITVEVEDGTPWDVIRACQMSIFDYIAAVVPFEYRSTLFFGAGYHPLYYSYRTDVNAETLREYTTQSLEQGFPKNTTRRIASTSFGGRAVRYRQRYRRYPLYSVTGDEIAYSLASDIASDKGDVLPVIEQASVVKSGKGTYVDPYWAYSMKYAREQLLPTTPARAKALRQQLLAPEQERTAYRARVYERPVSRSEARTLDAVAQQDLQNAYPWHDPTSILRTQPPIGRATTEGGRARGVIDEMFATFSRMWRAAKRAVASPNTWVGSSAPLGEHPGGLSAPTQRPTTSGTSQTGAEPVTGAVDQSTISPYTAVSQNQWARVMNAKQFRQYHIIASEYNLLSNKITASAERVYTQVAAMDTNGSVGNMMMLDPFIVNEDQRMKIVKSNISTTMMGRLDLAGKGNWLSLFTGLPVIRGIFESIGAVAPVRTVNNVAVNAMRESLMDMYQGHVAIVGNPGIKPYDMCYLYDSTTLMAGPFFVKEVIHRFAIEEGFTTLVAPDAVVVTNRDKELASILFASAIAHRFLTVRALHLEEAGLLKSVPFEELIPEMGGLDPRYGTGWVLTEPWRLVAYNLTGRFLIYWSPVLAGWMLSALQKMANVREQTKQAMSTAINDRLRTMKVRRIVRSVDARYARLLRQMAEADLKTAATLADGFVADVKQEASLLIQEINDLLERGNFQRAQELIQEYNKRIELLERLRDHLVMDLGELGKRGVRIDGNVRTLLESTIGNIDAERSSMQGVHSVLQDLHVFYSRREEITKQVDEMARTVLDDVERYLSGKAPEKPSWLPNGLHNVRKQLLSDIEAETKVVEKQVDAIKRAHAAARGSQLDLIRQKKKELSDAEKQLAEIIKRKRKSTTRVTTRESAAARKVNRLKRELDGLRKGAVDMALKARAEIDKAHERLNKLRMGLEKVTNYIRQFARDHIGRQMPSPAKVAGYVPEPFREAERVAEEAAKAAEDAAKAAGPTEKAKRALQEARNTVNAWLDGMEAAGGRRAKVAKTMRSALDATARGAGAVGTMKNAMLIIIGQGLLDFLSRWLDQYYCCLIVPLHVRGLEFSAGIRGHAGSVIGDQPNFVQKALGYLSPDGNPITFILASLIGVTRTNNSYHEQQEELRDLYQKVTGISPSKDNWQTFRAMVAERVGKDGGITLHGGGYAPGAWQPGFVRSGSLLPIQQLPTPIVSQLYNVQSPFSGGARVTSSQGTRNRPIEGASTFHKGVDLIPNDNRQNWSIRPVLPGKVVFAGVLGSMDRGYGNSVVVDHGNGLYSFYGHLSRISAYQGQQLQAGDVLGIMGSTGTSTGPHLHLEMIYAPDGNWRAGRKIEINSLIPKLTR